LAAYSDVFRQESPLLELRAGNHFAGDQQPCSRSLKLFGWLATAVMATAAVVMFVTWAT
jgi:hypothetical protein